jgi:hypothetical protein
MNIEIRTKILEKALLIEDSLSKILKTLLDIDKTDSKSLGHKSSSLTFMTKVDILYDIDKIDIKLYNSLKMFGEIRNQFMHNIDSDSYEIVLQRTGKKNKLIEDSPEYKHLYQKAISDAEKESLFQIMILELSMNILKELNSVHVNIIQQKILIIKEKIKAEEKEQLEKFLEWVSDAIDNFSGFYSEKMKKYFETDKNFGDTIKYGIHAFISKRIKDEANLNIPEANN